MARLSGMLPHHAIVLPDAGNHWLDTIALHRAARLRGDEVRVATRRDQASRRAITVDAVPGALARIWP